MIQRITMPVRYTLVVGQTQLVRIDCAALLRLEAGLVSARLPARWLDGAMIEMQARLHGGTTLAVRAGDWLALTAHAPTTVWLEPHTSAAERLLGEFRRRLRDGRARAGRSAVTA